MGEILSSRVVDTTGCVGNTIKLASGGYFDLKNPDYEDVYIDDIATALATACRYGGHGGWYSVAEHSVHVAKLARIKTGGVDPVFELVCLLHDAAEAYIGDMVKPLKIMLPDFEAIEERIERAIADRFGFRFSCIAEVKQYDHMLYKAEKAQLFPDDEFEWTGFDEIEDCSVEIQRWDPEQAEIEFLKCYMSIAGRIESDVPLPRVVVGEWTATSIAPPTNEIKPTNPKDAIGVTKAALSCTPMNAVMSAGRALVYGAKKYGRFNWRKAGVRSSVYYDALLRHISQWWEGEDCDADSGLSHVDHAIAGLLVLRDSMLRGNLNDDRPEPTPGFLDELNDWTRDLKVPGVVDGEH